MEQSATIGALAEALAKAQGEFPAIKQTRTAEIPTRGGGRYTYRYADLGDMIEQLAPILSKHGLAVLSGPDGYTIESWSDRDEAVPVVMIRVDTQLVHSSGEWIRTSGVIASRGLDAQSIGSALTYARRYGYAAILGVAPDTDDDGQAAMPPHPTAQTSHSDKTQTGHSDDDLDRLRKRYFAKAKEAGYLPEQAKTLIKANYEIASFNDASLEQLRAACDFMDKKIAKKGETDD